MRPLLLLVSLTLLTANTATAATTFSLPSGRLTCMYSGAGELGQHAPETLECQIEDPAYPTPKLRPQDKAANGLPSSATRCRDGFPYGDSLKLSATGAARWNCHSEPLVPLDNHQTLAYGKGWSKGSFTCTSSTSGVKCRNGTGHGFELSRRSYRLF